MARFRLHPDTFGDYNHIRDFVTEKCPSALFDFDEDELKGPIHATFWVSDEESEAAQESIEELGCRVEPA